MLFVATRSALSLSESDDSEPSLYCAGIVNYGSYADLRLCLESVLEQTIPPARVVVVDADSDDTELTQLRMDFASVYFRAIDNHGYAGGANQLLQFCLEEVPESEFCLLLNPDVVLDSNFAFVLTTSMRSRPDVALASGKLLRPGRELIDSAGIRLPLNRRPRDRGSEEVDVGQFDQAEYVFGVTGAAMMIRCSALSDLELSGEIFDEDFFLYYEDTDLSWRCRQLGWRVYFEPRAMAIHKRGWQRNARFSVPVEVRRHSFKNHYLQLIKNESGLSFIGLLPIFIFWEIVRLGFSILKDRKILSGYVSAYHLKGRAFHKRHLLRLKINQLKRKRIEVDSSSHR